MRIVRNKYIPFRQYDAINLFGILFCHHAVNITDSLLRHERIHTRQMLEMLVVFFYLWYVVEWLIRLPMKGRAYKNISFEREAYANMYNPDYLRQRRWYAWLDYLRQ